jgi:hypothetical protein
VLYREVKKRALQLLDQYSNGGQLISESDPNSKDFIQKFPAFVDEAQMEIATTAQQIPARKRLRVGMEKNLIATVPGEMIEIPKLDYASPSPLYIGPVIGVQAFSFEYNGEITLHVQKETPSGSGNWVDVISMLETPVPTEYAYIKKSLYESDISMYDNVRLSFLQLLGPSYIRNVAMYGTLYGHESEIPKFGTEIEIQLPDLFFKMNKLTQNGKPLEYVQTSKDTISIPRSKAGDVDLYYYTYPVALYDLAEPALGVSELSVSEEGARAIPHYLAAKCLAFSPQSQANAAWEMSQYQQKLANLQPIQDIYSGTVQNTFFAAAPATALQKATGG